MEWGRGLPIARYQAATGKQRFDPGRRLDKSVGAALQPVI